ncbi:MAG: YbaB/EbfC family nucleoid-associated protein [Chloroflexi bacterium]|nr:YbaB/EbfC family nucleoid-associated protein [Chloroflexota bacterium]MBT7082414.1 YbaB/EbfC family nucleoid-associated protein [Chloroflexota bacterium]MBT7289182.1 YbaB/EbfC family nucleoid-associated protein [Chloroflexota bacterium]
MNVNKNMMRQMQQMQKDLAKAQQELETATVEASSGGGVVTVTMNGHQKIQSIKIGKEAVDPDDVEMLEDLIMSAINEASGKAQQLSESRMGGFNIPGLT